MRCFFLYEDSMCQVAFIEINDTERKVKLQNASEYYSLAKRLCRE